MVSVLATEGSSPRGAGTRMLVTPGEIAGTIGGGKLEHEATRQARQILELVPGTWRIQDYQLGPLLGQCCGGRVRLLVEHIDAARLDWLRDIGPESLLVTTLERDRLTRQVTPGVLAPPLSARGARPSLGDSLVEPISATRRLLYLFGAGHVGQAIAAHARLLPLRLAWFDTRPETAEIAGVTLVDEESIADCIAEAPAEACIAILTHDHALDYWLVSAALRRAELAYVGLIGSRTKRARFLRRLAADGVGEDALERLVCPIGLAGVQGKEPDVIAISVLAQLLQLNL